jgi:chromosome partitioning protein
MEALDARKADTVLGNRVVYAETLGQGMGALERGRGRWTDEVNALAAEVDAILAEG